MYTFGDNRTISNCMGVFMKYFNIVFITILFFGSVVVGGMSNDQSKKGIYYDHVESTDNVQIYSVDGVDIDYSAELHNPGEYYELSFTVVNDSSVDVRVEDVFCPSNDSFIEYQLHYSNGNNIDKGDILKKGESREITYRVIYKNMIDSNDYQFDSSFGLQYEQVL